MEIFLPSPNVVGNKEKKIGNESIFLSEKIFYFFFDLKLKFAKNHDNGIIIKLNGKKLINERNIDRVFILTSSLREK